jgi:hypothetical protein
MKTELLNEYLFVDLVMRLSIGARRSRIAQMIADGISEEEAEQSPLTREDRRNAIDRLDSERKEISSILSEIHPDLPE